MKSLSTEQLKKMVLLRKELKQKVEAKLKKTTIKELTTYMKKKEISLWGQDKGKKFEDDCLLLALYHDLYGIGYNKIEQEIKNWRPLSAKSIRHNTSCIWTSMLMLAS